jgi:hypothetical protein
MDEVERARRQRSEFILDELRLAHIYLNISENPITSADTAARNCRHAGRILKFMNRLMAAGELDGTLEADIVAERGRLHERLSKLTR